MRIAVFLLAGLAIASANGATVHVSPRGDDTNPGTLGRPVASLARARGLVREVRAKLP